MSVGGRSVNGRDAVARVARGARPAFRVMLGVTIGAADACSLVRSAGPARVLVGVALQTHTVALGIVHGGMLAAFLDSAMGVAVFHAIDRRAVTLRLSLDYLGPGRLGDWLQAEGEVVSHDEHVAQVRGRLYGPRHDVLGGLGAFALLSRQRTFKTRS